jgi:hypothetical protein
MVGSVSHAWSHGQDDSQTHLLIKVCFNANTWAHDHATLASVVNATASPRGLLVVLALASRAPIRCPI